MRQAELFQKMADLARAGQPFVLATVVEADGAGVKEQAPRQSCC